MFMRARRLSGVLLAALLLGLVVGLACGDDDDESTPAAGTGGTTSPAGQATTERIGGSVSVLATWGGTEQDAFLAMVKPFEDRTGVKVNYEGTRDLNAVLTTRVQGGNPPDVAGLPGPGQMAEFARSGKLIDLGNVLDQTTLKQQYTEEWLKLAQVDGKQYGIFIKAAMKGPIWYDTEAFQQVSGGTPPKTWTELMELSDKIAASGTTPWCVGLESAAASGWPGTDWLEDIVLRQAGPDVYNRWAQGQVKWSSPEIKKAWETWGEIVGNPEMVYGGRQYMLATNFEGSGGPLFTNPPGCYMLHQGSFFTEFLSKGGEKPGQNFNFFPFPEIDSRYAGSLEIGGDLFGMFKDTPQARALIQYLTTPEAQEIWVKRGGAISPNQKVSPSSYPDPVSQQLAQTLLNAKSPQFDASDLMPEAMNAAFWKGVLDFVQNPNNLDRILSDLDRVQADAYQR
jgi:alpha-glucoside transport system substrate-binding protein